MKIIPKFISSAFYYWAIGLLLVDYSVFAQKVDTLISNGPSTNRIDIIFMGDGWTDPTQFPEMIPDLQSHFEFMFTVPVYERYAKFFNSYRIEHFRSGPPGGVRWQSHENMEYYLAYIRKAMSGSEVHYVVSREGQGHSTMGDGHNTGNGADNIIAAPTLDPDIIGIHLLGHAWHTLGDIYDGANSGSSWPDATNDPNSKKWERWMGFIEPFNNWEVGIYPIGRTSNLYRELNSSDQMMADVWAYQRMPIVFSPVEREKIVHDIYGYCDPVDSHTPNNLTLQNPSQIQVEVIDPGVLQIDWYVDDELAVENGSGVLKIFEHISKLGRHTIRAHVFDRVILHAYSDRGGISSGKAGTLPSDSLDWVRDSFDDLQQDLTWNVDITTINLSLIRDLNGVTFQKITQSYIHIEFPKPGNYSLDLYEAAGQKLKTLASGYAQDKIVHLNWNGKNHLNQILLFRVQHNAKTTWHKLLFVK